MRFCKSFVWAASVLIFAVLAPLACTTEDGASETSEETQVALLFVGHGEPSVVEDGDVAITLADGTPFGPHGVSLGVPENMQYTEWAAAYEEIATAMTYIFDDLNENDVPHEMEISPAGDVPPFFTWEAFHESIYEYYTAFDNYSPHNDTIIEHINALDVQVDGAKVETFIAFLDAVPRIPDVVFEITETDTYEGLVVVPLLLSSSTHTQEVEEFVREAAEMTGQMPVVVAEPYFEVPYMRDSIKEAVVAMADYVRTAVPADIPDEEIGVLLASHGTPYVPPFPEFDYVEGEIYSHLSLTEDLFHQEIGDELPFSSRSGRMNYDNPTLEDSLAAFEDEGWAHVMVVPTAFPTAAMHTMWDVANAVVDRAALPDEGVVEHTTDAGMKVYYSAEGFADLEPGRDAFRRGLGFTARVSVMELLEHTFSDLHMK